MKPTTRRHFLKTAALATTGLALAKSTSPSTAAATWHYTRRVDTLGATLTLGLRW